ncbi:hypothetical protein UFOVP201_18 [uncultured Caudovirales phage]|uniref:Uncharacterized protein n=1 Tax=uncultured Caudovirales phage TaxID=2100421 RepID=A0A6J7WJ56_9CAUD|nr:hypothetical protein UFOVP201_18 [uncultured Caudovirales phage]
MARCLIRHVNDQDNPRPNKNLSSQYREWWNSLSKDQQQHLIASKAFKQNDLEDVEPTRTRVDDYSVDLQWMEENQSSEHQRIVGRNWLPIHEKQKDIGDQIADAEDQPQSDDATDQVLNRLRVMIECLIEGLDESTDPAMRLHADVIRIVIGEGRPPRMSQLARDHGLTRAAVSLRCRKLLTRLGIEPSRFMRSQHKVERMRMAAIISNVKRGRKGSI